MDEHRNAPRNRVLIAGTVEFAGSSVSCMVRNISATGAALDVGSSVGIPEQFTLRLPTDGQRLPCQVLWRKERRVGVVFE